MTSRAYIVAKPFHTTNRRFAEGDPVSPADIAGPVPFARWVGTGHVVEKPAEKPAGKAKAPPPADA